MRLDELPKSDRIEDRKIGVKDQVAFRVAAAASGSE